MSYQKELEFVTHLFEAMRIPTHQIIYEKDNLSYEIDEGLRYLIYGEKNYSFILSNSLSEAKDNCIYRFEDEYFCHYLFFKLPEKQEFYFIGPYLLNIPSHEIINKKFNTIIQSDEQLSAFYEYYASLTSVEDENLIMTIANTLGIKIWGSLEHFTDEYIHYQIPDQITPILSSVQTESQKETLHLNILEQHYAAEKELMDSISQGKMHKVNRITSAIFNSNIQPRLSDTIRNRKNYMIILNTILRKAAENGAVHPVHLDRISSTYAYKIENIRNVSESMNLINEMIRNYCLLVKTHSLSNYSYLIGRAITIINYDLKSDLSLSNISKQLGVTSSYLSRLFKEEMKMTLTDYVNQKRIEYAVTLLHSTEMQIQSVAYECGIQDTNYFIKLFKKQTGLTPTKYRHQFVHHQ